jgi:hypothetical protein
MDAIDMMEMTFTNNSLVKSCYQEFKTPYTNSYGFSFHSIEIDIHQDQTFYIYLRFMTPNGDLIAYDDITDTWPAGTSMKKYINDVMESFNPPETDVEFPDVDPNPNTNLSISQ